MILCGKQEIVKIIGIVLWKLPGKFIFEEANTAYS